MVKGMYQFIRDAWKKPDKETLRLRMVEWRKSNSVERVEKPLRLDKARALGYKAKKGVMVVRVRVKRGGHKRSRPSKGRQIKKLTIRKNLKISYRIISEQRAAKKYKNMEVLNSYQVGKDGQHYYYEVILIDPMVPEIQSDKEKNWLCLPKNQKRPFRGLTSSGKKSRGLRSKE
jgi:large subunit ribosomal protein L15e